VYYGSIKPCDIANGTGVRVTLFVSGCTHRCKGCFQPQTWDFRYGQPFTAETEEALLEALDRPYISGLTLLGGEPFEPDNQRALLPFLHRLRQQLHLGGADRAEPRPLRGHRRAALPGGRAGGWGICGGSQGHLPALSRLLQPAAAGRPRLPGRRAAHPLGRLNNKKQAGRSGTPRSGRPVFSPQRPTSRLRSNAGPAPQWHLSTCHPAAARADAPRWAGYLSGGRRPRALRH